MKLATGGWLVIADGSKFLVFENAGTPLRPDLRILAMREWQGQRTAEMGTDRPGRYHGPASRRETVENTDWHRLDKARFATLLADDLVRAAAEERCPAIVLVADPRTLGTLRPLMSSQLKPLIATQIAADWTNLSVPDIERHLMKAR